VIRRFDRSRLQALPLPSDGLRRCAASERIVSACRLGAGPATRPWWQPTGPVRIEWPFGVFHSADGAAAVRAALQLDGSWGMADAGSAAARLRLRAEALVADLAWWRPLQDQDAWDAGTAPAPAALAGFKPRRATLILIDGTRLDADGARVLGQLEQVAWDWPCAVRVLLSGGPTPPFARPL
jgi:hypothetical protein